MGRREVAGRIGTVRAFLRRMSGQKICIGVNRLHRFRSRPRGANIPRLLPVTVGSLSPLLRVRGTRRHAPAGARPASLAQQNGAMLSLHLRAV